ncbi:hypothetical protein ABKN59_007261 [Abortiporus biennis]
MRRNPSNSQRSVRASSPTNTTYSGISNYKSESYRPINNPPEFPPQDPRVVARTHFEELSRYLASYLAKEPAGSRSSARQKLTRLTRQQFQELSTDVYDELLRRKNNTKENEIPFLPVRNDFHPKRNQARQKLATLPTGRFKDLSSDVYYELTRRYPEFKEESDPNNLTSPGSNYDEYSPEPNNSTSNHPPSAFRASRTSEKQSSSRRPSEDLSAGRRSEELYGGVENYPPAPVQVMPAPPASGMPSRRRPSQDVYQDRRRPSQDYQGGGVGRRPSASASVTSDSTSTTNAQSATAGMGMIIPNKSTIAEEEIQVPYGRDVRDSTGTAVDERERGRDSDRNRLRDSRRDESRDTDTDADDNGISPASLPSGIGGLAGLTALSARLQAEDQESESRDDYYDKLSYGRASVTSDRSAGGPSRGRASVTGEDHEKIRRDYEYRIATMQSRITGLERDLESAQQGSVAGDRVRQMEEELEELRRRAEEKTSSMRTMQKELDDLRGERAREKELATQRDQELQDLRERCEYLEANQGHGPDADILDQLRNDMEGLMSELSDLSRRNDQLISEKDADMNAIRDLEAQMKEYKRKYESAKTELRSVKTTSQLYLQPPKVDDQLPVALDGGLLDIHVTAFVSAIDSLLTAGRSNAPTKVLTPMKAVITAVSTILDDVKNFERRPPRSRTDVDFDNLRSLRDRAEATLSNLVTASNTHATSAGMSPVSLLDAAASHVSSTITEIGRIVLIRKASKAEQEQFVPPPLNSGTATNGFQPSLRSVEEVRGVHFRGGSNSSLSSRRGDDLTRLMGEVGASSSPPSDESGGTEDSWGELKPYLEAQTESIVFAIQSVLSGVRSPAPPPTLNENITQIITIVSSIVAVCNDNLPSSSATQGREILRELTEHANKLSEVQALPEVTKEARQIMAKSSFAVANAMKGLMKL